MDDFIDHDLDWGEYDDDGDDAFRSAPICKRCGKPGLIWYDVGGVWKLFEYIGLRLKQHVCPPKDHSDAFEDES